jgi:hypothetical protein
VLCSFLGKLSQYQFHFERLNLGSSDFDLLQCNNLLFNKFLEYCVIEWSFQALFCSDDTLFELCSLAFKFGEQLECLLLEWLQSLRDVHYFTLQCVLVVGLCIALRSSSFFRLGSQTSVALVAHLYTSLLRGVVPPMSAILDSLQGFYRSGLFWCLASYIPKPKFLIG